MHRNLTVKEVLTFQAQLRLPAHITEAERLRKVEQVRMSLWFLHFSLLFSLVLLLFFLLFFFFLILLFLFLLFLFFCSFSCFYCSCFCSCSCSTSCSSCSCFFFCCSCFCSCSCSYSCSSSCSFLAFVLVLGPVLVLGLSLVHVLAVFLIVFFRRTASRYQY